MLINKRSPPLNLETLTEMSVRSWCREYRAKLLGGRAHYSVWQGEFDLRILEKYTHKKPKKYCTIKPTHVKLQNIGAFAVLGSNHSGTNDLDRPIPGTMLSSHIIVCKHESIKFSGEISQYWNLHILSMAEFRVTSLYSRYILWIPLREVYFSQMP